jgi:hypothetical protein
MSDPNKPLPPPPNISHEPEPEAPKTAPIRLDRIISPLSVPDVHSLFSGAPQFFIRSEGHYTGAPHPSVTFPWDAELCIRDLSDHKPIEDEAWSCATAWPHLVKDSNTEVTTRDERITAHFVPRCRERPNMLSMQGLEKGTMGFQAALEMGVADALQEEDLREDPEADLVQSRNAFLHHTKHGLRVLDENAVITQLTDIALIYHEEADAHLRPTVELYTLLFTRLLHPPIRVIDSDDPYSLRVQIEALVDILATPAVWIDFSLVEWRIRLGQVLWGPRYDPDLEDDISINGEVPADNESQKFWLLLQILLASELLIRLDYASKSNKHATPAEINRFEKKATKGVKWSLILARTWLDNIRIEGQHKPREAKPSNWLSTLTGLAVSKVQKSHLMNSVDFQPRHQKRQVGGLLHFAKDLAWPNMETLTPKSPQQWEDVMDQWSASTSGGATPLTMNTSRSSYFNQATRRPRVVRGLSNQQRILASMHPSGWLSKSYLTGLILPGEGLSHFLISTLLENDDHAVKRLGEEANLYGGFVYQNKSFWSTSCIVGRVLGAGKGALECMGWISSDILPQDKGEGWVNVEISGESLLGKLNSKLRASTQAIISKIFRLYHMVQDQGSGLTDWQKRKISTEAMQGFGISVPLRKTPRSWEMVMLLMSFQATSLFQLIPYTAHSLP